MTKTKQMPEQVIFVNSHPIQYFAPFYAHLHKHKVPLKVWYMSKFGLSGEVDKQFGTQVKWDVPVLEGYTYEFVPNTWFKPSVYTFWGIFNLGLISKLRREPKSIIIYNGWNYLSYWIMWVFAPLFGHKMALRCETPLSHELLRSPKSKRIRKLVLSRYLKRFDFVLSIGSQNTRFHEYMGVNPSNIVPCPYSVNNAYFRNKYDTLKDQKIALRTKYSIPNDHVVFLTSGKYIHKKRPLDVIKGFHAATKTNQKATLVMVGDGNLRPEMESYIADNQLSNIVLTGFVNQSVIPEYYALSDVYVMASGAGETWGLSSNEAMLFNLPVIIASLAGSSSDLVRENGYTFPTDDVEALSKAITSCLNKSKDELSAMGNKSYEIIKSYSYDAMMDGVKSLLNREDSINR